MKEEKLSVLFVSEEHALDLPVRIALPIIMKHLAFDDIEEMYILDAETENYFLVGDFSSYANLEEIIQPTYENGSLSIFDFDIQLKNGVSIYTHENLTIEAPDDVTLFKYVDYIFRHFHLDAQAAKERIMANADVEVVFD